MSKRLFSVPFLFWCVYKMKSNSFAHEHIQKDQKHQCKAYQTVFKIVFDYTRKLNTQKINTPFGKKKKIAHTY